MATNTECPFCRNAVAAKATVCGNCNAFYGYSTDESMTEPRTLLRTVAILWGITAVSLILYSTNRSSVAITLFGLLGLLTGLIGIRPFFIAVTALIRGKKWWRRH